MALKDATAKLLADTFRGIGAKCIYGTWDGVTGIVFKSWPDLLAAVAEVGAKLGEDGGWSERAEEFVAEMRQVQCAKMNDDLIIY
jgi:hypothetical protein